MLIAKLVSNILKFKYSFKQSNNIPSCNQWKLISYIIQILFYSIFESILRPVNRIGDGERTLDLGKKYNYVTESSEVTEN